MTNSLQTAPNLYIKITEVSDDHHSLQLALGPYQANINVWWRKCLMTKSLQTASNLYIKMTEVSDDEHSLQMALSQYQVNRCFWWCTESPNYSKCLHQANRSMFLLTKIASKWHSVHIKPTEVHVSEYQNSLELFLNSTSSQQKYLMMNIVSKYLYQANRSVWWWIVSNLLYQANRSVWWWT